MFVQKVLNSYSTLAKQKQTALRIAHNIEAAFESFGYKKYKILEKIPFTPVEKAAKEIGEIPEGANFYTYVKIGKPSDPSYQKEIISFYKNVNHVRGSGDLIKRTVKASDENEILRTYKRDFLFTNSEAIKENASTCVVHDITTSTKTAQGEWHKKSEEKQFVTDFWNLKRNSYSHAKKLTIKKTDYNPSDSARQTVTLTQYPLNYGFEPKSAKKVMSVNLSYDGTAPAVTGYEMTMNVNFPSKDKFFAYRFLNTDDKKIALTKYFLKERKLGDMGIDVKIDPSKVDPDAFAHWSPSEREVCWGRPTILKSIANTAAHESEHAFQYKKIGQLGRGTTDYERDCRKKFGHLMSYQKPEAEKYYEAHINYPLKNQPDFQKKYETNFLEIKANEAGQKAEDEYNVGRNFFLKQFEYLPDDKTLF